MGRVKDHTDISPAVKKVVAERDSIDGCPCCIYCGRPNSPSNAHYIPRSHGGMGIEENILTLCPDCHRRFDSSAEREMMREYFKQYLQSKYENWNEEMLIYRKWS